MQSFVISEVKQQDSKINELKVHTYHFDKTKSRIVLDEGEIWDTKKVYESIRNENDKFFLLKKEDDKELPGDRLAAIPDSSFNLLSVNDYGYPTNSLEIMAGNQEYAS